jgi:hypothetical protein
MKCFVHHPYWNRTFGCTPALPLKRPDDGSISIYAFVSPNRLSI